MLFPSFAIIGGLMLLIWAADRFVDSAVATARYFGMPQLLIGMIIIGFGTSAPEMIVSATSALNGNSGIALGNAYGSNITNIALILGLTALISPLAVNSQVLKQELPILILITGISALLIYDAEVSRQDAIILLVIFAIYMIWTIWHGLKNKPDSLAYDVNEELTEKDPINIKLSLFWLIVGLLLLMISSQLLVWGAVELAHYFGVSDLVIGLTIVAVGTSLPELASSLVAAKKDQVDLAVGNIIGSNLFNTLAVVGIAGTISPMQVGSEVFNRDILVMSILTLLLLVFGLNFGKHIGKGKINRFEGFIFFLIYLGYNFYLLETAV
ncbi:calcium/sodium antiporter [Pasteurella bettyae]|uniref:K+-dependent Na+/Ca+ exchanger family protein n=1 Tax=Pasteurella bettyae CCUG 2042 TaxID=1095749 RepID=I3DFW1_9PAST|nr:calcium/sodium antiporter [Pasteurella bettyae]EIJ70604.1 K+-dependent Na+/Ca+ exchanger family protein [Pasteurella bettyae CCUG 2042]SUB21892.1 inner membrane protein YrbG [Pasteurella bettyae]